MAVNIVIVGGGRMGELRWELCQEQELISCIGIVELSESSRNRLAEKGIPTFVELSECLPQVDGVWCCAPTFAHAAVIKQAAKEGKHIYCEKPISFVTEDVRECYKVCEELGVSLFCGWMRRFDSGFRRARDEAVASGWTHVRIVSRDNPVPPKDLLPTLGDIFQDLLAHDINMALWYTGCPPTSVYATASCSYDTAVLDNAYAIMEFPGGRTVTIEVSRFSPDGYDQRIEVLGPKAIVSGENDRPFSFPQRYRTAFAAEVEFFAKFLQSRKDSSVPTPVNVCDPADDLHCITVVNAMRESYYTGRRITLCPAEQLRVRFIGCGSFGSYIHRLIAESEETQNIALLQPYTRSSSLEWDRHVLSDDQVDAVYVCSPDNLHHEHALACLRAGKHVLVEKPVRNFVPIMQAAIARGKVLVVAFHRRFHSDFVRARAHVRTLTEPPKKIVIESRDPVPEHPDAAFVVANSLSHDFDMLVWMLPDSARAKVTSVTYGSNSSITVKLSVDDGGVPYTEAEIHYTKCHPSYVQKVHVDDATFGFDHTPTPDGPPFYAPYARAYLALWEFFASLCAGEGAPSDALLREYARSFALMEQAVTTISES